jgi:hypothetical protein
MAMGVTGAFINQSLLFIQQGGKHVSLAAAEHKEYDTTVYSRYACS